MASYQISTASSIHSFVFTPKSFTKDKGVYIVRVGSDAHVKFIQEKLEQREQFLIRTVTKEKDTFRILSASQWKILPNTVQFFDAFGIRIEAGLLQDLEDFEEPSLDELPTA